MLRIIISPAKKMNQMDDYPVETTSPRFLEQTEALKSYLSGLDYDTLKTLWKCNDKIARLNWERLQDMDLHRRLTPAVFAYEGIQYQSMAPGVLEREALEYIGEHLYILSGFYGILQAFDGVVPYRLEMQARLAWQRADGMISSLYDYWGDRLCRVLTEAAQTEEEITIVNLASVEYSRAIEPWLSPGIRYITCVFGEIQNREERVKVKATAAKMARGAMVRFLAEQQMTQPEQMKTFDRMGYRYLEQRSDDKTYVFGVEPH